MGRAKARSSQTLDSEDACEVVVPSVPARAALPRQQSGAQAALGEGALCVCGGGAPAPPSEGVGARAVIKRPDEECPCVHKLHTLLIFGSHVGQF